MTAQTVRLFAPALMMWGLLGCATQSETIVTPIPFAGKDPRHITSDYVQRRAGQPFILIGAGDVAACDRAVFERARKTANVIRNYPDAIVFTAGDNVYRPIPRLGSARSEDFENCYGRTWGQFRERTLPAPGNHDYGSGPVTHSLDAYFRYFGRNTSNLTTMGKAYYSAELGTWHLISLDSDIVDRHPEHADVKAQILWLQADLAQASQRGAKCVVAIWHHSRFARRGPHKDNEKMQPFWDLLVAAKADIAITGHSHHYEAHEPKNNRGQSDPNGLRQFVVGTGGIGDELAPNKLDDPFGVLKLTLEPDRYSWQFIHTDGPEVDAKDGPVTGSGVCKPKT